MLLSEVFSFRVMVEPRFGAVPCHFPVDCPGLYRTVTDLTKVKTSLLPQALWLPSAEAPKLFLNRAGRVRTEHIRKAGPGHVQIGSQEVLDWTGQGQGIDRDGEILLHLS